MNKKEILEYLETITENSPIWNQIRDFLGLEEEESHGLGET